jgi:hypothetical protein
MSSQDTFTAAAMKELYDTYQNAAIMQTVKAELAVIERAMRSALDKTPPQPSVTLQGTLHPRTVEELGRRGFKLTTGTRHDGYDSDHDEVIAATYTVSCV